jgi:hypothetical protein
MSWDTLMEKFGDEDKIGISASWIKDNLLKSFVDLNKLDTSETKEVVPTKASRGRGRPKGSKNKKTLEKEQKSIDSEEEDVKIEFKLTNF